MEGIRYYGLDDEQPKENRTLLNDLDHIFGGINQVRKMTAQDRELNNLAWDYYYNPDLTDEQLTAMEDEYNRRQEELEQTAREYQRHKNYLDTGDSYASQIGRHALSAGSSLESMEGQYGANLAGALAGAALGTAVAPGLGTVGGAIAGWKATNIPTAIRANYRDAEAGAYDTWNEVMEKTGDPVLAKQAFYESLKPNLGYAALATIPDIAITGGAGKGMINFAGKAFGKGSKAVERASRIAKAMERAQQSRIGRGIERIANKIPDIDLGEGAGAWVAGKFNNPLLGKVARGGVNLGAEVISEIGQEAEQGISTNAEVARALHQYNPEQYKDEGGWSLDRAANWLNSEEGRTTMLDTAVSTLLTGGAQTALGGFAKLPYGYNNKYNLRNIDNIMVEMGQGGILQNISPEKLGEIKHVAGVLQGLQTDEEISAQSPEQAIRIWLEDASERAQKQKGLNEEEASAYAINNLINNATEFSGRPDYLSEASQAYFDKYKIQKAEGLIDMEIRQREEQKAKEQTAATAKETHEGTIPSEVAPQSYIDGRKSGTIDKDGNPIQVQDTQQPSDTLQSKISNILPDGQAWSVDNTTATGEQYAEGTVLVKNNKTNKLVRVDRAPDGKSLFVTDITPVETLDENNQPVQVGDGRGRNSRRVDGKVMKFTTDEDGFKNLGKFFLDNQNETKTLKQERDEQSQQAAPPDPNRRRVMVNGVHDLANFYRQNSDLMDRDTFMLTVNNMMAYGNGNISLDLDLENDNNGIVGEVDPDEIDQMLRDGTSKAIIHLYQGADAITVLHEFAHVGYKMMSAHEQQLFNRMAEMSEASFVADMLKQVYPQYSEMGEDEIIGLVRQAAESGDGRVWRDISNIGVLRQTIDILNGGADEEQHQRACEERYAWEFTMWYIEGYTKGKQPTNRMQQMLNRTCGTLGKALELIGTVAERLQSDGWQAISNKSMVSMFENMNTRQFNTGNPNTQRMYGGYMTGEQQEQLQRERELAEQQAQQRAAQQAAMEQAIVEQYNGSPQQQNLSGETQQTPATVSGEQQRAITTQRNRQRREQDTQKLQAQKEPVVLRELQKLVDGNENFTDNEAAMVQKLSPKGFAWYANRVLSRRYPNEGRMAIISSLDKDGKYKDAIEEKRYSALKRGNTFESRRNVRQSMKNTGDSVIGSLRTEAEQGVQTILGELLERKEQGQKQLQGYINGNKKNFETQKIYKEAMRRFKSMQTREATKYDKIASETLRNAAWNSTGEIDRTEDGDSVYGTVNPPSVLDSLRRDAEEVEREKQRKYIGENEDKVQDKYKKLMDKYESGGLEAVGKTMNSPAIKKDPTFWNEAYNRLLKDVQQREEQKKAEEQQKQAEKEKAFEDNVQKVVGLLNEKQKKSENSLKMFLVRNSKKFKEDPIYAEAKKRFDEGRQSKQETTQEQVQEQQPAVRNEVQQQEQVQPASQTVQTEKAQPVVESKEEETTKQVEEPKAEVKEETTNGKTEDSGRVEDIRGTEGEVQTGRDNGVSTNQRLDVRQHRRNSVETTGTGNGESVSLLKDKKGKPIGRKIEKVNNGRESKDTKRVIEAAYDGEMPLSIDGFVDITGSKNADGDKGIDIFNKLFGTNYDSGNAVVHQSGKSGYVIDDDGNCIISIAKKQKGVLTNTALIARLDERVNYVYASEIESATISAYKSVGFEPIARIYKDRDAGEVIVFEKTKQTPDELIDGFKSKGKKRVKVDSLPTFNSREEFERRNEIVEKTTKQNPISEETRNNINEKIGDAVSMFPTTSDKELEEVISKVDEKLKNDKSTSKMKSETRYRLETLRSAAQEELENRKKDVEFDEDYEEPVVANREILEGGVLNTVSDAENLYVERYENKANKVKDTITAKQILEESGVEEKEEQDEQVQEEVEEGVEEEVEEEEEEDTEDTIEGEPSSLDQFFEYFGEMADQLDEGVEDSPANALLDKIKSDTEKLSSDQTEEDKGKIKDRIMKNMKKFNEMINNYQERVAQEELDDAKENSYTSDKEVTPQLPQKLAKEVNLTKFDPDNSHRIVISDLTTNGKKNKGIAEKDAVSITEVQDFVRYLHKKYDTAGTNINLNYVEMDEEDKKKLGSIYRKLSRQKNLVQERLKSGVYGTKYTKTNPNSIYSHARAYLTEISSSNRDKGGLNLIGVLKQIMNTNLVYEYKYGFDEIDQKKKVTDAQLDKARKNITNLRGKIEALQEQRRNASTKQERRTCTRKINELVNELKEQQILLWSHGTDFRGNGKYQDEAADWSLGRWKAYQRKLERQLNRSGEFKEIKKWRRNNKLKRANEERIAKSTPTLDKEVSINEGQLQDEDNWNNFFNGFKKNIEPLYKNAKKTLNGIEDVLKFRTLKEIVKLHKNGKDVEGMLNNVTKVVDEAESNGHLSEEEASKYKGAIKDLKKAFFKETGQEEKIAEMDKEPAKKQRTEKKVIELTQEEGKRIKQIENEFSEVMKPFQDFSVKYESGQPITKQDYERAIKVANPLNTLIKKYSDPKNIPQNMSDNEKQVRQNLMNEMQNAKKRVQEVKSHYTQFKKGNFTPVFKSLETVTPQQITTTKPNKSKSETTQKPTQQNNTKQETNKSTKSEQKGKTLTADKFKEITDGMFSMLDNNEKALRNTTVEKLVEFLEKGGYTLTPRQRKSIENKLGMRQERLQQKDNKTETATEQNKQVQQEVPKTAKTKEEAKTIIQNEFLNAYREYLNDVNGDMKAFSKKYGVTPSEEALKWCKKDSVKTFMFFHDNIFDGYWHKTWEKKGIPKNLLSELNKDKYLSHQQYSNWKANRLGETDFFYISQKNAKQMYTDFISKQMAKENQPAQSKTTKPNKSTKSRHMETDVIPDTSVEENRDINSITFTKSALKESKVNRDRAKALHDNNKYWKETKNPDGSITYTRQKRQPWHTKAVTYSGINGKEVSKEPLGKISEGFQRVWNWYKEKWLNEQTAIKDLAESVGAPEAWMDFVVQKDMGSLGMTAIERGIVKHNSKTKERTAALMDFAKEFKDEQEQLDWLDYCEAQRIVHDLHPKGIEQKMTFETANKIINKVKNSSNAKRFEEWRQKFVEYNKELLHVLVDGNIITEDLYQKLIKEHPNFIPLSKDMSDFDEAMSFMSSHKDLLNVKSPLHRIGSSLREVKNPLLEMQKRTMDYYQRAAQNKAALTFIDKIVTKITKLANGDEVMLNQAILHKLAPQYTKKGTIKDISDPNKGIFYVMRNGKKEFYQLSDASVYKALRSLSPEHMGGFEKFVNFLLSKPAQIVRTLATITFDFAIGNLYRDAGEAFMTSRHGYLPLYDSFWGMWQMYNDTEWFKEYNSQVGDMTSRIRENGRIAGIEDNVENKLFRIPVIGHIARAMKTFNEYMEQGTRIGEYKNARMGYEGTLGRLRGESANLAKANKSKEYAAFRAKDITLNFLQHGAWGKKFNRVTPFFNAALQGQYKIINTIDEMIHNKEGMRNEMLLKAALIAYLSFMTGWNGAGDDDYEEAPDWERDNYTIRGDGSRTPKDQVLGKLIGNPFEQLGYYAKKGKFKNDAVDTLVDELKALALPDNLTPAFINLWIGLSGGHDTFKGKQIVPEYMKDDLGYLQKDLSTSNFATDLSKFAYDTFGIDVSAKKLDWSINQFLSNTGKYWNKIWDTARTEVTGEKNERTGHMYMEEDSKGAADYLNYSTGNNIIDGTLDLARMAFGKKFIQNQTTFDSLQDFNEEYLRLKKLSSDPQRITKEETKAYETIYKPAYDKIKKNRSKLSEIGKNSSLDKNQKLVKSRPIILDSIRTARDAEKAANKLLKK